jgi:hypothetical protein
MPQTRASTRKQTARSKRVQKNKNKKNNGCNVTCQRERCDELMRVCIEMVFVDKEADRVEEEYSRLEKNLTSAITRRESPSKIVQILARLHPVIKKLNMLEKHHEDLKRSCMHGNPKGNLCKASSPNRGPPATGKSNETRKLFNKTAQLARTFLSASELNKLREIKKRNYSKVANGPRLRGPPATRPTNGKKMSVKALNALLPSVPKRNMNNTRLNRLKSSARNLFGAKWNKELKTEVAKVKKKINKKSVTQANLRNLEKSLPSLSQVRKQQKYREERKRIQNHLNSMRRK